MKSSFFKKTENNSEKEGIRLNKRMVVFIICLLISVLLWLLLSLSKEYKVMLSFPVKYINMPEDKLIANKLTQTIDIEVEAKGFYLIKYKINPDRETIVIDLADSKSFGSRNHSYLLTNFRTDKVLTQFSSAIQIIKINPDTIFLNFNKKMSKHVPVKSNLVIDFEDQYQQTDEITLNPKAIEIYGSADVLEKIDTVETVSMNLKNVKTSMLMKMEILRTPELKLVELSQNDVQVNVKVAKFTEASIDLPIEVENIPTGYSLKTFPDKVTVKYNIAFENYEKINASQFRVVVDYAKIEQGSNKLKIILVRYPPEVRGFRLNTEKVEYIIRK